MILSRTHCLPINISPGDLQRVDEKYNRHGRCFLKTVEVLRRPRKTGDYMVRVLDNQQEMKVSDRSSLLICSNCHKLKISKFPTKIYLIM